MTTRPFKQVDVFTAIPYLGNPLAVVLDGAGLDEAQMQAFARWTNLSETTFLLPPTRPEADYRVRIFTPGGELPFAGHPTLGSCHAWLQAGGKPKNATRNSTQKTTKASEIIQECQLGLVRIQQNAASLAFAAPPLKRSAPSATQLAKIAGALGLKSQQIVAAQVLDNGPVWLGLLLDSTDTVLALTPNHLELKNLGVQVGVAGVYIAEAATQLIAKSSREARAFGGLSASSGGMREVAPDLEVRAFAAPIGVNEDPVTGSLNASLAQWLIADGYMPQSYLAAQGGCLERAGRVSISRDASEQVWVGGAVVTCVDGMVRL
ncbi:MAG: PhzF family phenazine biosynthesis protein [Burkholderiaceae bacterium]|nr:PhzF family phenazine biosynthesis protein [Burkholderiaceae bacterium]